jgi:hypothetical protein
MVRRRNRLAWWARRESRSVADVVAIAFVAGTFSAFMLLFVFEWIGIFAGAVPFLQFGFRNKLNLYEYLAWISSFAPGVLVFAKVYFSGAKSLDTKRESRDGTTNGKPPIFAASVIAILATGTAFCATVYLSACIGFWSGLIAPRILEPHTPAGKYEMLMWFWSAGFGIVAFWIVYRKILLTSRYFLKSPHGDSSIGVSE